LCEQRHIGAESRHIPAAVVQREQEPAGQVRRRVARAHQRVQLAHPQPHVGERVFVLAGERGGDDVAGAFVPLGGEQPRVVQRLGQRRGTRLREASQLNVSARGDVEVPVTEAFRRRREDLGLTSRQEPARQPETGQPAVVRGMQPQRSGAGVAAIAYGRFVPVRAGRRGG
jgi:hypothetical protein